MTRLAIAWGLLLACASALAAPEDAGTDPAPAVLTDTRGHVPSPVGAAVTGHTSTHPHCSASRLSTKPLRARPPLPPEVEDMRRRIIKAAVACDYAALERLGHEKGEGFSFTFGPATDAAGYWREEEDHGHPVMALLVRVLNMPYAHNAALYAWPSVYRTQATAGDWRALAGLYPKETLHQWQDHQNYLGLRVGIQEGGDWMFAVEGD